MKQTSLDLVLRDLQTLHAVVLATGNQVHIWSPGVHVPSHLLNQVNTHKRAVKNRVERSSIYVCPSPGLHRSSWEYVNGRFYCRVCEQLQQYVS